MESFAFYERYLTVSAQDGTPILCRLVFAGARTSSLSGDMGALWRDESPALELYDESRDGQSGEPGLFLGSYATDDGTPWWRAQGEVVLKGGRVLSSETRKRVASWATEQAAAYPLVVSSSRPARRRRLSILAEGHVGPLVKRRAIFTP